jgi:hypothetical protein
LDVLSAFRPCGRNLVEFFKRTRWALSVKWVRDCFQTFLVNHGLCFASVCHIAQRQASLTKDPSKRVVASGIPGDDSQPFSSTAETQF